MCMSSVERFHCIVQYQPHMQVTEAVSNKEYERAQQHLSTAKHWSIAAVLVALIVCPAIGFIVGVSIFVGTSS